MIGKPFGDHRAEHPLDLEVHFGAEIDRALLLDTHAGAELGDLQIAGAHDRFDRGRQESGIVHALVFWSFLTMRISMPPGTFFSTVSSMKLRIRKMPRPLDLRMFSGASGSATSSGTKPSPWSSMRITSSSEAVGGTGLNSTMTRLLGSFLLPCLMALTTDSRTATDTQ